jgi:hypothetical protein
MKRLNLPKENVVNMDKLPSEDSVAGKRTAMLNDVPAELQASISSEFSDYEKTFRTIFRT